MVFESLVVELINRYLGSYIEALNASQLKIGLLGGNAQLENLDIKANAFDDLDLPVKVLQGHISSLTLKIPFKNLFTEPTIAELTGLYVLIVPNIAVEYDEAKEKRYAKELKQKELVSVETARLKPKHSDDSKADSFGEKLAAQVIKNLQISIKDIHIRYEDSFSIPNRTFSLGLTLSALTFQTCDSNQKPIFIKDESIRQFIKFVKLTSLGVYWNPMSTKFAEKAKVPLRSAMRSSIASPDNLNTGFHYLVKPISSTAMLHIHTRPEETNYSVPQMDLVVNFSEIELCFSLSQYHDITCFLEAQDRIVTQGKYRKYRPLTPISQNYKVWWRFAYNAVLEESVRRRHLMWSWEHISKHRKISREYIAIWRKKLSGDKLSQAQLANIEAYEEFLDVFNIVLCRQQAELQKHSQKANSKSGGGWFGWFSRGSAAGSDDMESSSEGDLMKRLETEMTSEEKAHLFAVIDYSESAASGVSGSAINFPISYVSSSIAVTLRQLSLVLLDDKLSDPNVLKFSVNKLTADVKQRAGDQALAVSLRMDSLEALGAQPTLKESYLAKSSIKPVLITSHVNQSLSNGNNQAGNTSKRSHLLCIDFEKNPLDRKADQRISIQADALQIVYDAETINKIVHFFTPPKDVYLQELSNTVLSSFEEVKEVTTSGLRHLATNRSYTDVHIDIKPSYFILPDSGIYRSDCRLLLVDLGSFTVNSSRTSVPPVCKTVQDQASSNDENKNDCTGKTDAKEPISNISGQVKHKSGKLTFDELKDEAYDKFNINLSSVQVIMVNEGDDWRALRKMNKSSNHILKPLALSCTLKRCVLRNDVNLPRVIVDGCLPVFSVDFTDAVLKSLYELIVNVPFPEADKSLTTPANPDELLKDVVVLPNSIIPGSVLATRDLLKVTRQLNRNDSDSTLSSWVSDTVDDDLHEESEHDRISQQSKLENDTTNVNDDLHGSQLIDKNKSKAIRQRDQANLRRKRAKLIDLKLDFVIRKVEIQVLERQLNSQNKNIEDHLILSFNIHEVGTSLIKRRWTQEIQAHIGTLSVAIPQFTHRETYEPVYLARTQRHEETGHHLLAVQLIIAEKNAPDFDTYYQNTRHRLQCDFKVLDVYVHQEATLLLMNYFNNLRISLSKQSKELEHSSEIEWATSIGDIEGLKQAKLRETLENEMKQQLPGRLTAADAVGSHIARKTERRNIRMEAASLAQKTGKVAVIPELNITQWMVNATLDKVNVTLGSKETDLFSTTVNGLRIDVRTTYDTVEISAILSEFIVIDHIVNTSYRKILWVDPTENVVSLQITHFQDNTQSIENSIDPDKVDLAISLQIGKLHSIFLYHFITRVLNFMEAYQEAVGIMSNKFQALSDAAVQQVHEAVDNSSQTRLSLNIVAQAPVIYMPQHSLSNVSLMIDFGRITLSNHFEFINPSKVLPDTTIPVPEPGIMLEHMVVRLENLRLSRVVLKESSVQAEKHVLLPINVELKTRRNLNPNIYSAIPILLVNGGLNEINISLSQGDYRVLQEVLLDNFNDLPSSTKTSIKTTPVTTDSSAKPTNKKNKTQRIVEEKNISTQSDNHDNNPVKITISFDLGMKSVILNLYTCDQPVAEWLNDFPEDKRLATFNLKQFNVSGQMASDSSSQFIAKLNDINLQDSRPGSDKQITRGQILRVLGHSATKDNRHDELIYVEFNQDALLNKKIQISLRSIHLCASMDYLMSLLDFQMKSTPTSKNESNNLTSVTDKSKQKRLNNSSITKPDVKKTESLPTAYPFNLELKVQIDNPELVLVEDIYNVDSNAIKLTTELSFGYNMKQDIVVINALINSLSIAACPYNETVGGPFSKEILSPSDLSFYASQPINGSLHGTLHMDTLTININPNTIRLLSAISSSVQSSLTTDKNPDICETVSNDESMKSVNVDHSDEKSLTEFWKPIQLKELNMPYLGLTSDSKDKIECVEKACDIAKVVEETENRRIDIINIRLKTIRIILESQLDTKFMPMLVLDSTLDAVLTKPITHVELKFLIELSLSYYNDSINQWEPLIETLPEEGDRMWSLQLELVSINNNKAECLTDDDWENVGCLQASTNTILILSRDNLEITISKTALEMLNNLGRSFEAAYKLKNIKSKYDDSTNRIIAPYCIMNKTGCQLMLRYNSQALSLIHFDSDNTMTKSESLHQTSSEPKKAIVSNTEHDIVTYQNSVLLDSQQEIGFTELAKTDKKQSIVSSYKDSRHHIWISLSDTSHQPSGSSISNSEVVFQLYRGDSELLCLSKDPSNEKPTNSDRKSTIYPIVADVEACLGVKSITFRSTVQVLNNTSERICIYSHLIKSSVANHLPGLLTIVDAGQSYALPVEIVNSRQQTGIFIGPEYEKPVISVTPAYWPEFACGVEKYTPSNTNTHLPFLAPYAQSVSSTNTEYKISNSSQFKWPNQLVECHTNSGSMNNNGIIYFYNVAVVNHNYQDNRLDNTNNDNNNTGNTDQQRKTSLTAVADELRATQKKMIQGDKLSITHCDFQMIIQTAVVLYNQLPFSINFILTDITDTIAAGSHYALKTASPNNAYIEISFEYTGSMYRGKLELHPQMEEYSVIEFESRKEYEVFDLPLGLHRTSNLGQICLTLYAPYWMINKTEKDLTYKSVDDVETVHPATFTGALLYSSLSKSFFGKRKIHRNHSFHSLCSDEDDENEQLLSSSHQLQSTTSISDNNNRDLVSHGTEEITTMDHLVPMTTTLFNRKAKLKHSKDNSSSSSSTPFTRKWWNLSRSRRKSCHSSCCHRSLSRKRKTHTLTTRRVGDGRALKFDSKIQANLRVCESNWSDKFSLDTVGSSGRVHCTTKSRMSFEIGVKIDLSSSGLTKIVTFMPYFVIINKANINIDCCEVDETETKSTQSTNTGWIKVPAGEAVPFWPHATNSKNMLLKCRVSENIVTAAFPFYESHSILMKLDGKYPGIFVEVETTEETTVITLQMYQEGMALVRLVNNLDGSQPVFYHQSGIQHIVHRLDAGMSIMYAWDCPQAKRELIFYCNETDNRHSNKLTYDSIEEFKVNNTKAYLVSFMWNMQRVLLFTQNANVAKNARLSSDLEPIDQEIVISLQSIGISLVDNHSRAELAYISITSSGVRWSQVKRGNRLKPLELTLSENLERAYTNYVNASNDTDKVAFSIVKLTDTRQPIEVDFNRMIILKPDQYGITRAFDPGVFLQYKSSISQMQLHAKLFRLQVDSQRLDSTFPVVLSAFPQPKSVALDSGFKPLFEWSAIIGRTANPGSFRFKYFHVLIQEMQLKLDQGFLYDITNFFSSSVTRTSKEEAFKHDYLLITSKLIDLPVVQAHMQDGNRSIFDSFHISPIKVHVSFSLTGSTEGKSSAFPSEVLNLFLQSLGVALTEVQDVVFKLDYFERQACIMTLGQMSTEITHHYVGQGVRQMYVLVLGLDVLGNPFGVLRGLAQGVEDLFYEPVKGAILGPEEFAEGVTLGVRSLLGHAVGGAAGAVSRITGTLGKGIAALTLDEEYKRKRREQLARRPETFGAGLAQGGRGLVMGVFHGVTGVVTKPFEGAKREGVEGFFKGFGKGLVGAVTRPVSGVVDFASSSFEGIRRLADTTQEVSRVRPPRFIRSDGIIRPYDKREADGYLILKQVDKDGIFGQYLFHIHSVRGNSALILTTNNLLIIESMDLLGTFSIDWKTPLENLSEAPVINKSGILIKLKEKQKKLFTSGHQIKQFDCDLNLAKLMISEINLAMTKHEHLDSNL
ncbi:unnamed protein product [Schistosoma rodhaini]|nr:unnamed protein product [Schistosoma rodhaini]